MRKALLLSLIGSMIISSAYAMGTPPTYEAAPPKIEYVRTIGGQGSGNGQFLYPRDVAVGAVGDLSTGIGNIFVADTGNNRVQAFDSEGDYLFQFGGFGNTEGKFNSPVSIAVDFNFRIYTVDKENSRIQKFDIRGNYMTQWGEFGTDSGQFKDPVGMTMDSWGRIFVAELGQQQDRMVR